MRLIIQHIALRPTTANTHIYQGTSRSVVVVGPVAEAPIVVDQQVADVMIVMIAMLVVQDVPILMVLQFIQL